MFRKFALALCVTAVASTSLLAAEIRGTVKSINPSQNTLVMIVDNQERTVEMAPKTPVYTLVTVGRRRRATTQLQQTGTGVTALQPGMFVTVITQNRNGMEMATEVRQDEATSTTNSRRRLIRR